MLDVLREAGVVDAGGAGLVEIVRGLALATAGEPIPEVRSETAPLGLEAIHLELSRYRYCTGFVVEGDGLDLKGLESSLERLGDSLLVVGDESAIKVHVHTDDPGAALSVGTVMGVIGRVEIADMHAQTFEREGRLLGAPGASVATLETGVVAVCQGEGNRRLFKESRRDDRHRRRSDDEPLGGRDRRGDRRDACRRGHRSPEQLERHLHGGAGDRARLAACTGGSLALGASRASQRSFASSPRAPPTRTRRPCSTRSPRRSPAR